MNSREDGQDDERFCPYCGDELAEDEDLEAIAAYHEEHDVCPHWDVNPYPNPFDL